MNRRQRMCERRGATHYKGRVFDPAKEWGPQHTCLEPAEHAWQRYERAFWRKYHCPPTRPLEGETTQQYLSHLPGYDGTEDPPSLTGRRLPDGRWESGPPAPVPPGISAAAREHDPYGETPDEGE